MAKSVDGKFSRKEKRPYIIAFKRFVRDPDNRDPDGHEWTAGVILNALWLLSEESERLTNGFSCAVQFRAAHYQTVERLRLSEKQSSVDDPLLFSLIKRFLKKNRVQVASAAITRKIRNVTSELAFFLPQGGVLPAQLDPAYASTLVYEIETVNNRNPEFSFNKFMAIRYPGYESVNSFFPAIAFRLNDACLEIGVYCYSLFEMYTRDHTSTRHDGMYFHRYRFGQHFWKEYGDEQFFMFTYARAAESPARGLRRDKSLSLFSYYISKGTVGKLKISSDPEAKRFAEAYLKQFDT